MLLLVEVISPIGDTEGAEAGGEGDSTDDVDLLGLELEVPEPGHDGDPGSGQGEQGGGGGEAGASHSPQQRVLLGRCETESIVPTLTWTSSISSCRSGVVTSPSFSFSFAAWILVSTLHNNYRTVQINLRDL